MSVCRKYERMISTDIDGELSPEEEREMQLHLNSCRRCRTLKIEMERMCASMRVMDTIPAPKDLAKKTMGRVREAPKSKVIHLFQKPWVRTAAGMAACAVFCVCLYGAASQVNMKGAANDDSVAANHHVQRRIGKTQIECPGDGSWTLPLWRSSVQAMPDEMG